MTVKVLQLPEFLLLWVFGCKFYLDATGPLYAMGGPLVHYNFLTFVHLK